MVIKSLDLQQAMVSKGSMGEVARQHNEYEHATLEKTKSIQDLSVVGGRLAGRAPMAVEGEAGRMDGLERKVDTLTDEMDEIKSLLQKLVER